MDKFVVRGGNPLLGTIKVSGAKNSALPCMAAAILTEDEVILENIPQVRDIETERKLLASMGAEVELGYGRAQHRTRIKCAVLSDPVAKYEIVKTMRASSLVLGPLIARTGIARVAMPGGCAIGGRPIDLHIKGLEAMGATITQEHGYLEARSQTASKARTSSSTRSPSPAPKTSSWPPSSPKAKPSSKTAPASPKSPTSPPCSSPWAQRSKAPAPPPSACRASAKLHGARHRINPDRIEAGTFLIAGAITGGDLNVDCCEPEHLGALIAKLEQCGVTHRRRHRQHPRPLAAASSKPPTSPPKSTPASPPTCRPSTWPSPPRPKAPAPSPKTSSKTASCMCRNSSAWARTSPSHGRTATVRGKTPLQSAAVMCSDLRASASLVLAALVADGETILDRVYHLDRGYEHFEEKLRGVGAQIRRMGDVFGKK